MRAWKWTLMALVLTALLFAGISLADAGDFAGSYDYGGSDWGGSDWDSGPDWDSGSDWGDDLAIGMLAGSALGGDGGGLPVWVIVLLVVFLILGSQKKKKGGGSRKNVPAGAQPTAQSSLRPMAEYTALDPGFKEADFTDKISNLYVRMQNAWEARAFEPMRPHMTDNLYNQFARQLESYVKNRRTNRVENIAVLGVTLMGFRQDAENDTIVARLRTRITDYTVDDQTGKVLSGDPDGALFMEYEWSLVRAKGAVTESQEGLKKSFCPNCGAPVELNRSAKCEYCGTILSAAAQDWAIAVIKGISRQAVK